MKNFNIDDIKVSEKLNSTVKDSIDKAFKNAKKEKYNLNKKIAVASVAIIGIGTLGLNNPTVLAKIKEFRTSIEGFLNIENPSIEKYSNGFAESVTSNGITVKINDLILDNHSIKISTSIDASKSKNKEFIKAKDKIEYISPSIKISINDLEVQEGASSINFEKVNNNNFSYFMNSKLMDDSIRNDNNDFYKNNKIIENIFNSSANSTIRIKLEIPLLYANYTIPIENNIEGYETKQIELNGNWTFEKEISLSELISQTNTFEINKIIEFNEEFFNNSNESITVKDLTISPISIALKYETGLHSPFVRFDLYDENNNIIDCFSSAGSGKDDGPIYTITEFNGNIKEDIIRIVPILMSEENNSLTEDIPLLDKSISINIKTGKILE